MEKSELSGPSTYALIHVCENLSSVQLEEADVAKSEFAREGGSSATFRELKREAKAAVRGVMYDDTPSVSDDIAERAGTAAMYFERGLREMRELEALASNHGSDSEDYDAPTSDDDSADEVDLDEPRTR